MPNWVYNGLSIQSNPDDITVIKAQLSMPPTKYEGEDIETPISFWNIVRPKDSEMGDYRATIGWSKEHSDWKDHNDPTNWYQWNIRNWGCKWDCSNPEITGSEDDCVSYTFETPWGYPEQAFVTLSKQYPEATLFLSYEEENGWGGEIEIVYGTVKELSAWDWKCPECDDFYAGDVDDFYCENCENLVCPSCKANSNEDCDNHKIKESV